jgi:hypothetical protein
MINIKFITHFFILFQYIYLFQLIKVLYIAFHSFYFLSDFHINLLFFISFPL